MNQQTQEWYAARLGKVTASSLYKALSTGAERDNYMTQLVLERLTGQKAESHTTAAMQWGVDQEPFARAAYEAKTGRMVDEVGFIPHPTILDSGASPDGLVGVDGMIEIKCPDSKTALECWLSDNPVSKKYYAQMQWQMRCASRWWCDYVVFDPRLPPDLSLFVKRIQRDDKWIAETEQKVIDFLTGVTAKTAALNRIIFGDKHE